jgi:hypothetical protein
LGLAQVALLDLLAQLDLLDLLGQLVQLDKLVQQEEEVQLGIPEKPEQLVQLEHIVVILEEGDQLGKLVLEIRVLWDILVGLAQLEP